MRVAAAALVVVLFTSGCDGGGGGSFIPGFKFKTERESYVTPTRQLSLDEYPLFHDDLNFNGMKLAIERQLTRFAEKNLSGTIQMGQRRYPLTAMKKSLEVFRQLIWEFESCSYKKISESCYQTFNQAVRSRFDIFIPDLTPDDPRYGEDKTTFFTGYHTMPVEGSARRRGPYQYPIYANPGDSRLYFTRLEIDFLGKLANRGLELMYAKSLFDIYLLHVQGSGRAILMNEDGTTTGFYLNYDGTNRKRWEWISKYMVEKGYIANGSVAAQRKFLRLNPQLHREIFSTCPSYVFMKVTGTPPLGNDSVPVTDGRSIAQDSTLYKFKGLLAYVESERPAESDFYDFEEEDYTKVEFRSFSRFFLDQDTGGAIKGKGRADIYFGEDDYAYFSSMHMRHAGNIYYMMAK